MSDLRQQLIDEGWRQGVILAPGPFQNQDAIGFLVLNQTCDCISPDLENEPCFELLPLRKLEGEANTQLLNGCNARRIHFQIEEDGAEVWVAARMADIEFFDRSEYTQLGISGEFLARQPVIDDVVAWRASRYLRPAFPEGFEQALKKPLSRFKKFIKRDEALIDSILISLDPFDELEDGEKYELQLRLMVDPIILGEPTNAEKLKALADKIQEHLEKCDIFFEPTCGVTSLEKMNLLERKQFLDFSRFDYLSFGEEPCEA